MASSEKKHGESLSLPHNRLAYARYATTYPARLLVRTVADRRGHSPSRPALYRAGKRMGRDAGSGAPSPRMARMACRVARGSPCRGNVLSAVRSAGPAKRKAYRRQPRRRIRRADALRRSVRTRHRTGGPRLHEDGGKVSRSGRAEVAGIRGRPVPPGIVWCAKEALYKWSGLGGLDWLRDIRVTKIDPVRETLEGTAGGKRIGLKVIPHPELHIVFCAG